MRSLPRRIAVLSVVATCGALFSFVPAHADAPYHEVHYSAKKGDASVLGLLPEPSLDITGVGYGFNGHYLHFSMDLAAPSQTPPLGFQQADYIWRFSYGNKATQAIVQLATYSHFGVIFPDYIGVTVAGSDTTTNCSTCFGVVNMVKHRAEFFANLDDFNSTLDASAATAGLKSPPQSVKAGSVLKLIEADTQAETAGGSVAVSGGPWVFVTDTATAPKGMTFKL